MNINAPGFRLEELYIYQGAMVLIFYTHGKCYQFCIRTRDGSVQENQYIFSTCEAACLAARESLISD
ncbi:hypothetical protein [Gloeothece verrucosa]|uniref:Uncharacterized protein n=1 Tax=Gloeothece verrucosa (strain PCC 7822) TaxID=497965 RepID=E0UM69_GLOV7|nr:hypothetical protein [Gloeothece verrucosa]ADN18049.1 conserved hypothetical protein [Gloeothece verrucosa PCC 7822]